MKMIPLKVPQGHYCKGCMFLEFEARSAQGKEDLAYCQLFNKTLSRKLINNVLPKTSVEKCYSCPVGEWEEEIV